jgi:ankyrin repeat protein
MRNELGKTLIPVIISVVFGSSFLCIQGLHAKEFDRELESSTQLIVMIEGLEVGAGVIFGWDTAHLYIVTASHVVRTGSREAQNPQVRLKALPEKRFRATLLANVDRELDLAVLRLEMLNHPEIDPCAFRVDRLGRSAINRGDPVYAVGNPNGVPWGMPVVPDRAAQIVGAQVMFQSAFISKGHSGGGLLNGEGELVGMIRADQPPFGIATSIGKVLPVLKAWGYPVRLRVANSPSPLYSASEKGSVEEVKYSLKDTCPEINVPHNGVTPLLIAADHGYVHIVRLLLDAGAAVEGNGSGKYSWRHEPPTPLEQAAWYGHLEVAQLLMKAGAKTDFSRGAWSMLFQAIHDGNAKAVKVLLEVGADVNGVVDDIHSSMPLHYAVKCWCSSWDGDTLKPAARQLLILDILLQAGANPNATDEYGATPLCGALGEGSSANRVKMVEMLLNAGAEPNVSNCSKDVTRYLSPSDKNNIESLFRWYAAKQQQKEHH